MKYGRRIRIVCKLFGMDMWLCICGVYSQGINNWKVGFIDFNHGRKSVQKNEEGYSV